MRFALVVNPTETCAWLDPLAIFMRPAGTRALDEQVQPLVIGQLDGLPAPAFRSAAGQIGE